MSDTGKSGEVRTVNEKTGGEKGVKLARMDLVPADVLMLLSEHYGKGAAKYTKYGDCTCVEIATQNESTLSECVDPATKNGSFQTERKHLPGCGALKVQSGDRNWEKGYEWSKSYAALLRHLLLWWNGEDTDMDEVFGEFHHLDAVLFHAMALRRFSLEHGDLDDRPNGQNANG